MPEKTFSPALWPYSLPPKSPAASIKAEVDRLDAASQYGWGHTIDFGPFRKEGLLREDYLDIAGVLDDWALWPSRLDNMRVADIGCFTGGLSLLMAHRGAEIVYALDEIPEHLAQCSFLASTFGAKKVRPILGSTYQINDLIEPASLDLILFAGVLYHLSDMLVGLHALRSLLKPGGILVIQSNALDDFEHSYANFGRFFAGTWWQPTALCIKDMCEHMGFVDTDVKFYGTNLCVGRAVRSQGEIPFRRGLNWRFDNLRDLRARSLDWSILAPAPRQTPQNR